MVLLIKNCFVSLLRRLNCPIWHSYITSYLRYLETESDNSLFLHFLCMLPDFSVIKKLNWMILYMKGYALSVVPYKFRRNRLNSFSIIDKKTISSVYLDDLIVRYGIRILLHIFAI